MSTHNVYMCTWRDGRGALYTSKHEYRGLFPCVFSCKQHPQTIRASAHFHYALWMIGNSLKFGKTTTIQLSTSPQTLSTSTNIRNSPQRDNYILSPTTEAVPYIQHTCKTPDGKFTVRRGQKSRTKKNDSRSVKKVISHSLSHQSRDKTDRTVLLVVSIHNTL